MEPGGVVGPDACLAVGWWLAAGESRAGCRSGLYWGLLVQGPRPVLELASTTSVVVAWEEGRSVLDPFLVPGLHLVE